MVVRKVLRTLVVLSIGLCAEAREAAAQEAKGVAPAKQATTPAKGAAPAPAPAGATTDRAQKEAILSSPEWRRAMFEFKEWLSAQPFYTPAQVEQIKANFNQRVANMNANEVAFMLADMETKFQIINTPEAQEARSWMAQYLSVMSDKKRAEVLKDLPNLATMTAAQLNKQLMAVEAKRANIEQRQAAFAKTQQAQVTQQLQQDTLAREDYIRQQNSLMMSASPYRSPTSTNQRLNDANVGAGSSLWGGGGFGFGGWRW